MPQSTRLLVVDPDRKQVSEFGSMLAQEDCYLVAAESGTEALELARHESFDLVICEFRLEGIGGLALIAEFQRKDPHLPVVMVTKNPGSNTAIEAIKSGAYDFLAKPVDPDELRKVVREAVAASRRMSKQVEIGVEADSPSPDSDALIGKSREMLEIYKALGRLSATPVTVLIRGETGTGKE
ncbi:MAG: sigma-54-dependent Fis family transcriptional regulator, partial [Verrucomicrobiales bacterium]|nr:sigma-54-dependent Fis family transcriptional regulator [Verrucomicrobiales bacterium]